MAMHGLENNVIKQRLKKAFEREKALFTSYKFLSVLTRSKGYKGKHFL